MEARIAPPPTLLHHLEALFCAQAGQQAVAQADAYIQDFRSKPESWSAFLQLLQPAGDLRQALFAASTLRNAAFRTPELTAANIGEIAGPLLYQCSRQPLHW